MNRRHIRSFAAACALAAFALPVLAADAGSAISLTNKTDRPYHVIARTGEKERCEQKKEIHKLTIAPGETATIESGGKDVCWCFAADPRTDSCMEAMSKSKPGSLRTIR
ncbi:MAG: hypothetical protein IPJ17_16270 [Holophagales bacterium]|nr:MAG: hypothetical protein IPJ17_16270 [Holophagales bacterium]